MDTARTDVSDHSRQAWRNLLLNIQVPLSHIISLGIRLNIGCAQRIRGERRSPRKVIETARRRIVDRRVREKRSRLRSQENKLIGQRQNIEDARASTHRSFSVLKHIPCKANPRLKVSQRGIAKEWAAQVWIGRRQCRQVRQLAV